MSNAARCNQLGRRGVGDVGRARLQALNANVAVGGGEVDKEETVARVLRMKRHAEQAALAAGRDAAGDVEERCGLQRATLDDANLSTQLDDEDAVVGERRREKDRACKAGDEGLGLEGGGGGWRGDSVGGRSNGTAARDERECDDNNECAVGCGEAHALRGRSR